MAEALGYTLHKGDAPLPRARTSRWVVALDGWTTTDVPHLYGAVSSGNVWQFLVLQRSERRFEQDVTLYRVPEELPDLCAILLGILQTSE